MDKYSYHEALDRTHIQLSSLEMALGDHPVIQSEPEAKALYDKAIEHLADLYQVLGRISLEKTNERWIKDAYL